MKSRFVLTLMLSILIAATSLFSQENGKAYKQYEMGMYVLAAGSLERYLQDGEVDKLLYLTLADCYDNMNEPAKAVEMFERSDQLFRLGKEELMAWGMGLKKLGNYEAARMVFSRIAPLDPALSEYLTGGCEISRFQEAGKSVQVRNLHLNTVRSDFGPVATGGGLLFVSSRDDLVRARQVGMSSRRNAFQNRLFVSRDWSGADPRSTAFYQSGISNRYNSGPVSVAEDAGIVAFTRNNYVDGQVQLVSNDKFLSIHFATVGEDGQWEDIKPFPYNCIAYATAFPFLTEGGKKLYFASNMDGGLGGFDLYESHFVDGEWTDPVNLGDGINTEGDEVSPCINGGYLYFASNWHPGMGGFDNFRCALQSETIEIENLGAGINSPRDDYGLSVSADTQTGFFTSNRLGGKGLEDIYAYRLNQKPGFSVVKTVSREIPEKIHEEPVQVALENGEEKTSVEVLTGKEWKENVVDGRFDPNGEDEYRTVYSIQVAALSQDNEGYQAIAEELSDIGEVYKVFYARMIKVRVGSFPDEENARHILTRVKERGYPDAFIVREEVVVKKKETKNTSTIELEQQEGEQSAKINRKDKKEKTTLVIPDSKKDRLIDLPVYKVRIAAYTNPEWFDRAKVEPFGDVQEQKKDEWYIYYLGDFGTIEEAERVRQQVREAGFSAARLYTERNGELIKVN